MCIRFRGEEKKFMPEEIVAMILQKLKEDADKFLDQKTTNCVISVPSCFDARQRQALTTAGKLAKLNVKKLVHDNSAAAFDQDMHIQKYSKDPNSFMVIDFGGSSFKATCFCGDIGFLESKSEGGEPYMGGVDLDRALVE